MALDPCIFRQLRLLTWTVHAPSEHGRLKADAAELDSSLFLLLWREELSRHGETS
jgi:hypothetical protein